MYGDRIEISSKGSLYGRGNVSRLGKGRPENGTPALANILELLKVTNTAIPAFPRYSKPSKAPPSPPRYSASHTECLRSHSTTAPATKRPTLPTRLSPHTPRLRGGRQVLRNPEVPRRPRLLHTEIPVPHYVRNRSASCRPMAPQDDDSGEAQERESKICGGVNARTIPEDCRDISNYVHFFE